MKKYLFLLFTVLLFSSFAPEAVPATKIGIPLVLAILTGLWELVGRLIPSVGQITVIGKILEILSWISNFLNRKKK